MVKSDIGDRSRRVRKPLTVLAAVIVVATLLTGCAQSSGSHDQSDGPRSLGSVECESQSSSCWGPTVEQLVDQIFDEDAALADDCREAARDAFSAAGRSSSEDPPWAEGSATVRVGQCEVAVEMVPGVVRGDFVAYS